MENASAMSGFVTALTTGLTPATFYGVLTDMVPWIAVVVVVSLGFYFLRRSIKGVGNKGKLKI